MRWYSPLYITAKTHCSGDGEPNPRNHSLSVSSPINGEYNHTLVWIAETQSQDTQVHTGFMILND